MFQTLYVAANVRNLDMDRANEKETSSVQRRAIIVTLLKMLTSVPIVANTIWLLLKTVNFTHVQISDICSNVQGLEHMTLP
jgi:hypothetical protein